MNVMYNLYVILCGCSCADANDFGSYRSDLHFFQGKDTKNKVFWSDPFGQPALRCRSNWDH